MGTILILGILTVGTAACAGETDTFHSSKPINVISRKDDSGTRGAFTVLFGIVVEGNNGNSSKDRTTKEAVIAKQTDIMMQNIAGDRYAIGYISIDALNNTVTAVQIDGAAAAENVINGSYTILRLLIITTKGEPTYVTQDFISYILFAEGQFRGWQQASFGDY